MNMAECLKACGCRAIKVTGRWNHTDRHTPFELDLERAEPKFWLAWCWSGTEVARPDFYPNTRSTTIQEEIQVGLEHENEHASM